MTISVQTIATRAMEKSSSSNWTVPTNSSSSYVVDNLYDASDRHNNSNGRTNRGEIRTFLRDTYDWNNSDKLGGGELDRFESNFPGILPALSLHR